MTIYSVKRLIVVLMIAALVFRLAKPVAVRFMSREDYSRRRFVWIVLTIVSFLSPSFWLYALAAALMLPWANRRDSNPVALYLFILHVIPPVGFIIPILGNNGLFELNNYRLLAFFVLLPATLRYRKNGTKATDGRLGAMDVLLLIYGALQILLYTPPDIPHQPAIPDSLANALRRAVLFFLDTYLLYFTVSRTCQSRQKMVDAVAAFCLACLIMASIAIFENMRHWLLYVEIESVWGVALNSLTYLTRGSQLRAQASAGHSLSLGFLLAIGFGFWLYLKTHVEAGIRRTAVTLLLWGGLFAAFSRGPWLGAVTVYFTFFAAGQRALSRLVKSGLVALALALMVMVSPVGDQILDVLPIFGHTSDSTIVYRQLLAQRGWEIVMAHPFFGDQFPWPEMEDLRQGEGIIDIVNSYLGVALNNGLIGLFCFLSFILLATARVLVRARALFRADPDLALFGTSLIACIVGTLVMIYSMSFNGGCEKMFYTLAGFATAYARLTGSPEYRPTVIAATRTIHE
jgi:O-antigen ligase